MSCYSFSIFLTAFKIRMFVWKQNTLLILFLYWSKYEHLTILKGNSSSHPLKQVTERKVKGGYFGGEMQRTPA